MARKKKEPTTIEYRFKNGDNITEVAQKLTGKSYMVYKLLLFNGLTMNDVKDGTVLKWS